MTLPPGIHRGIPEADYVALPYVSKSALASLSRSAAHYQAALAEPSKETPDSKLGTAAHCAILEPNRFAELYRIGGQCDGITSKKVRCENSAIAWIGESGFCGRHLKQADMGAPRFPVKLLSTDEMAAVLGMRESFHAHPKCARLLAETPPENRELTLIWQCRETGAMCKARLDGFAAALQAEWDVKTCYDASPNAFARSVYDNKYHWQRAHNLDGCAARKLMAERSYHVAIEKCAPYSCAVYTVPDVWLLAGRHHARRGRKLWAQCTASGVWPGPALGLSEMDPPGWLLRDIEADAAIEAASNLSFEKEE